MLATLVFGTAPAVAAQASDEPEVVDWWGDLSDADPLEDPAAPPVTPAVSAPLIEDEPVEPASVEIPEAGVVEVSLGSTGDEAAVEDAPIEIAAGSEAAENETLQVEVLERSVTESVASGFGFRLSGEGGAGFSESAGGPLPVEVSIDYSGFDALYGGGYGDRLQVVALPACALQGPPWPAGCDTSGVPLSFDNNEETSTLAVDIDDLTALDAATLASDEPDLGTPVQVDDATAPETAAIPREVREPASVTDVPPNEVASTPETGGPGGAPGTTSTTAPASTTTTSTTRDTTATTGSSTPSSSADPGSGSLEEAAPTRSTSTTTTSTATTSTTVGRSAEQEPAGAAGGDGETSPAEHSPEPGEPGTAADDASSLSASGGAILAITSGPAGESGTYAATPFELSADWQVGIGSGEFNWSYAVPVPSAPAGATPSVALGYSSGAVDGMVAGRNSQAGQLGLGWGEPAGAFIERRYTPCTEDGGVTGDFCWKSHNATISLNGQASELVPVDGTFNMWRLKNDPNWRVERRTFWGVGDNDGEHWVVHTPDGTEYTFGLGTGPDGAATTSVWTAPVFANNTGEPCRASGDQLGWCQQGWRWNLDRVVDPNGNVTSYTYFKGTNYYAFLNGWGDAPYTREGRLDAIHYGWHESNLAAGPAARVVFDGQYRCSDLDELCPGPSPANAELYPDVPNDMLCLANCGVTYPSFFSTSRYYEIETAVRSGSSWSAVDIVRLAHGMPSVTGGDRKLVLLGIQRIGKVGLGAGELLLPPVRFATEEYENRVDYTSSPRMPHHRVTVITEEYGGQIRVTYGRPNGCTPGTNPRPDNRWDLNNQTCFPRLWKRPDGTYGTAVFHKWLVTEVQERDQAAGSPPVFTNYTYEGTPAWHHDDDEFAGTAPQTWSDWRGYGTTLVEKGGVRTRYRVYRGMDQDRTWNPPGTRSVSVTSLDGTVTTPDHDWFAGRVLEEAQLNAALTSISSTLTEYQSVETVSRPDPQDDARWVGEHRVTESRRTPTAGYVKRRTTTTVDDRYRPFEILEEGWLDATGDERCTRTTYAQDVTTWMLHYPATEVGLQGQCTSGTELHRTERLYDNGTLNAAPTRGNVTQTRNRRTASSWGGYTTTAYDVLGRPTVVTDPLNRTTTTTFTPTLGLPTQTSVTNAENQTTTTTWQVERGLPVRQEDVNDHLTTHSYDALGRRERVWLPTEQPTTSHQPSLVFSYVVDFDKDSPPGIRTRQRVDATRYEDAWVLYDGFLRERQAQAYSPATGEILVETTTYDARGNVATQATPQAVAGTPGSEILLPAGGAAWANDTVLTYDSVNRIVTSEGRVGGADRWETTTSYTHNSTTVTPPRGGATLTVTDAYDRQVKIAEQTERGGTGWAETDYSYDLADNLTAVSDPAGNEITYTYDMLGQLLTESDPNSGDRSYAYDLVGNQSSVTDAEGTTLHTSYDQLNRPYERRRDSATGPLLASWAYDAAGEAGLLDSATRHTPSGDWTLDVDGYDARGRPAGRTWSVPAGVPGLAGDYTVSYGYDLADNQTSVTYAAMGDLPAETITTSYSTVGLPTAMSGLDPYVGVAIYDNRGRPGIFGYGDIAGGSDFSMGRYTTYDDEQRPQTTTTAGHGGQLVAETTLAYDALSNITERTSNLDGHEFRECYTYDDRNRLTDARTTADLTGNGACDNSSGDPTGDLAYEESYSYSIDGNMTSRTVGSDTVDYTYPSGTDPERPHAATAVEGDTYGWDENGNLESRTVNGDTDTFAWDPEQRLQSITSANGTARFVYDTAGQRLLQETPAGDVTLYIEGHEITSTGNGTSVNAVRSYTFNGELIATRSASRLAYVGVDRQGSIETQVPDGSATADSSQAYTPYGEKRTADDFDTQRGWVGQVEDDSSELNYLNARYYDPNLASFISPDPLLDLARPQTLNPYAYALGNPTTNADPSGLWIPINAHRNGSPGWHAKWKPATNHRNAERARTEFNRSYVSTANFARDVGARRRTYNGSSICWCHPSWANPLVQIAGMAPHTRAALQGIATLRAMQAANPNPAFWREVARTVHSLQQMHRINPNPEHWAELAAALSTRQMSPWILAPIQWAENQDPIPTGRAGPTRNTTRLNPQFRTDFLARNPRCIYCGAPAEHVDHFIPRARGGLNDIENLGAACRTCNQSKNARMPRGLGGGNAMLGILSIIGILASANNFSIEDMHYTPPDGVS